MLISRISMLSGEIHVRLLPVTQEQLDAWNSGVLIQVAMPNLSADDREFIKTGITTDEWESLFGS
jgi:hypothetical protein